MTAKPAADGRNLDPARAGATGEGASIEVDEPARAWPIAADAKPDVSSEPVAAPAETYYDLPIVKEAPWKWYVPAYFYAGGLAGAAATMLPFAEWRRDRKLAHRLHWIATLGEASGATALIADLGRPARFHHMLRVFRPTSPMNLGTWILSAASGLSGLSMLGGMFRRTRVQASSVAGAVAGSMLSTYTGVLLGNTAIPIWQATRDRLPLWFAASSAMSLASALELVGPQPPRVYAVAAKAAELAGAYAVERAAQAAGVDAALREGNAGRMWRASKVLAIASLGASAVPVPGVRRIAGALGTAAALVGRFAIVAAGKASAADPQQTLRTQRAGA